MRKHQSVLLRITIALIICLCLCQSALAGVLTLPVGLKKIESEAFAGDQSLDEVILPEGVATIGAKAFAGSSLRKINLPASLTAIADDAFDPSYLHVRAEEGSYAYYWATDHCMIIGDSEYAYWDPTVPEEPEEDVSEVFTYTVESNGVHIQEYTGHKSVVVIPSKFDGVPVVSVCLNRPNGERKHGITKVVLPSQPLELGNYAFYNLADLATVEGLEYVTSLGEYVFFDTSVKKAVFSSRLRFMASGSIAACIMRSITIPSDINYEAGAFYNFCLEEISLVKGTSGATVGLKDGVLFSADGKKLLCCPAGKKNASYEIPEGTEAIGVYAFNSDFLYELTIPSSVIETEYPFIQTHEPIDLRVHRGSYAHQAAQQLADQSGLFCCVVIEDNTETFSSLVKSIVRQNASAGSDYDKALALHDWLISHSVYDDSNSSGRDMIQYGKGVCNAYANAYRILLDEAGLENKLAGNADHIFNAVKVSGSWMYVDCTWDDVGVDDFLNHQYFGFEDTIRYFAYGGDGPETLDDIIINLETLNVKNHANHYWYKNGYCNQAVSNCRQLILNKLAAGQESFEIPLDENQEILNFLVAAALGNMKWTVNGQETSIVCSWSDRILYCHVLSARETNIDDYDYDIKNNKVRIMKYKGEDTIVVIPAAIAGIPVAYIGPAFFGNSSVKSVFLPESIVEIEGNAFRNAVSLRKINIPANLEIIGDSAFHTCVSLETDIILPEGFTSLGFLAFFRCEHVKKVSLPGTIQVMKDCAFLDCIGIEEVDLAEGITRLANSAFSGCCELQAVQLPNSLEAIGHNVFYRCGITSLIIPKNVSTIGISPVQECPKLKTLSVDRNNPYFKSSANIVYSADGKKVLFSIMSAGSAKYTIPSAVTTVGARAFYGNTVIKELIIPGSVKTVEEEAFADMTALESIKIENGCEKIGNYCFGYTKPDRTQYIQIADSINELGTCAFAALRLDEFHIPPNITNIPICLVTSVNRFYIHENVVGADPWAWDNYSEEINVYGTKGTFAETFAKKYGIHFVPVN